VAVPFTRPLPFEFDSAEHGAALFNLEVQGNIYTRIGNPTNTVLEKRIAALEGGVEALSVSSGMAAIHYALANITEMGNNIVSLPNCTAPPTPYWRTSFQNKALRQSLPPAIAPRMSKTD